MNYVKAQAELKEKYPPSDGYFHNYLFPHNEKRTYRNQLTLVGENVIYLGVTLKDKTNRHWLPTVIDTGVKRMGKAVLSKKERREWIDSGIKVAATPETWPLIGNNAPDGYKHYYEHNGLVLSFKRPKLRSYFTNILNCDGEVKYLGLRKIEFEPTHVKKHKAVINVSKRLPLKKNVIDGAYTCCYCNIELTKENYTREHIIPKDRGGKDSASNLLPCCFECNNEKDNLMLHSYIQLLNYKMADVKENSEDYITLQVKIINANNIAASLSSTPPPK